MAQEERVAVAEIDPIPLRPRYTEAVNASLLARRDTLNTALDEMAARSQVVAQVASLLIATVRDGHKVLAAGNGGSAAEAQHFAGELVGRFKRERQAYPVLSLTVDTSILTAIANDYSYHDVFARQIEALGQPGDLFIAISTSGKSENLIRAARVARQRTMTVIAITGDRYSPLGRIADLTIRVPSADTAITQELHTMIVHVLCDIAEKELAASEGGPQE
ncbi:MAG TPA: SIS domain-containing protein [Ktedonobacterales bacterium]